MLFEAGTVVKTSRPLSATVFGDLENLTGDNLATVMESIQQLDLMCEWGEGGGRCSLRTALLRTMRIIETFHRGRLK